MCNIKIHKLEYSPDILEKFSKKNSSSPYDASAKIRETAFREPLAKNKKGNLLLELKNIIAVVTC